MGEAKRAKGLSRREGCEEKSELEQRRVEIEEDEGEEREESEKKPEPLAGKEQAALEEECGCSSHLQPTAEREWKEEEEEEELQKEK